MKTTYLIGLFLISILVVPIKAPLPALLAGPMLPMAAAMFGVGSLFGPKLFGNYGRKTVYTIPSSSSSSSSSYDDYSNYPSYGMQSGGMAGGSFGEPMFVPHGGGMNSGFGQFSGGMGGLGGGRGGGMGGSMGGGQFGGGAVGGGFGNGQFDMFGRRKRRSTNEFRPIV